MKKLSVIIVNYNVCYFLEQALLSVRKALAGINAEVFVVDNNSVDGSVAMVQKRFPEVNLIINSQNQGFSKANNQAIRQATGQYILLLNPDTVVEEDTFTKCIAFMEQHPEAGGLGVKMLDGNGNFLPESKRGMPTPLVAFYKIIGLTALFPHSRTLGQYYLSYQDPEQIQEVDVLAGAFMFLRRTSLEKTGCLDEAFFMYGEDIDLSYRLQKAGYKNYYLPHTRIIHYKGESTRRGSLNYVYLFYQAMSIFVRKHFSSRQAKVFSFIIQLAIFLRASISMLYRFGRRLLPFTIDAAMIYGGMYLLKEFWESTYKPEPGDFPDSFMQIAVPAYIFIWLNTSFLMGAYDKPHRFSWLWQGVFVGTVLIAAISNFLDQYRFSKALILLGALLAVIVVRGRMIVWHFWQKSSLGLQGNKKKKIAVVGNEAEYVRVTELLRTIGVPAQLLGFLSPNPTQNKTAHYLGELRQLNEITRLNKLDELIFCGKDLSASQIIEWMVQLNNHDLQYKILPEGSEYIIGSHAKDAPGDYYALQIELNLLKETYRRQKRLLDISSSIIFIFLSPLIIWQITNKSNFLNNCWRVLVGQMSWVGLKYTLPPAKAIPAVLTPADKHESAYTGTEEEKRKEVIYAKEYSVFIDLQIIKKGFKKLGRHAV